ncbi:MAG: recombination mediator RecR [Candidatus Pacebacteria bacterium]|nr:recombination mediator RecR [Candidatus Paceibacterota bacterium]
MLLVIIVLSPSIENLIKIFAKFPTIGPKTAARFVFYLLDSPALISDELIKSIQNLKTNTKVCPLCFRVFEPLATLGAGPSNEKNICEICANPSRDKSLVCVVEKEIDLEAIEKTATYKGLYFILGGVLPILKKETVEQTLTTNVEKLRDRVKITHEVKEIILAINPTLEGQNTILWLKRKLEGCNIKISCLAQGIPLGGEIEYADEQTIESAIQNRR